MKFSTQLIKTRKHVGIQNDGYNVELIFLPYGGYEDFFFISYQNLYEMDIA